jgi:hypothetical protein
MPTLLFSVRDAVDAALGKLLLTPVHADELPTMGSIRDKIFGLIRDTDLVLACVTPYPSPDSHNPNVHFEVSVSLMLTKPLLICMSRAAAEKFPAYIADLPRIEYDNDIDLAVQIRRKIKVK